MIFDENIRNMVWINVLSKESVDNTFIDVQSNKPVWIDALERKKQYFSMEIGIARGLFWVPVLIRLCSNNNLGLCDCCGNEVNKLVHGFLLGSDFMFEVTGLWPHPFSPRQLNLQKGNTKNKKKPDESIVSFKTTKPAWTQFSELLFSSEKTDKKEGYTPAPVISQYYDLCGDNVLRLLIGGYRNKQAAILQRRHELYSIPAGWNDKFRNRIIEIIEIGLDAEATLTDKVLYPLVKGNKDRGEKGIGSAINANASALFFHFTEPLIHQMFHETSLREFIQAKNSFLEDLSRICLDIFERVTRPYAHKPELIGTTALARDKLKKLLKQLKNKHTVIGGTV
jgi:CRISPR system Cascade subunit CasA